MGKWPKQDAASMNLFYGNPDADNNGVADAKWCAAHLVQIAPPYPMFYPTQTAAGKLVKRGTPLKGITCHAAVAPSLLRVLTRIGKEIDADTIRALELDITGGAYCFRLMRNGRARSIHSWGAAFDLSHLINRYKRRYDMSTGMMPSRVIKMFADEGWTWGGQWTTPDPMHFQAADV